MFIIIEESSLHFDKFPSIAHLTIYSKFREGLDRVSAITFFEFLLKEQQVFSHYLLHFRSICIVILLVLVCIRFLHLLLIRF